MAIETVEYIAELNQAYPAETEGVADGDDHLRNIKKALKQTFPGRVRPEGAYLAEAGASITLDSTMMGSYVEATQATSITLPKLGSDFSSYNYWLTPALAATLQGTAGDLVNGAASLALRAGVQYKIMGSSSTGWRVMWTQEFPSGTRGVFAQASAPPGWVQDTSDNANNRMLRVVSAAGNGIGGSHSPILMNVVPAHTHGVTTGTESVDHSHSGNTGTISVDHSHGIGDPGHSHVSTFVIGDNNNDYANMPAASNGAGLFNFSVGTDSRGTGIWTGGVSANHTHGFGTGGRSVAHTHSGTTDNGSSQVNWTPRYIDLIICAKG